MFEVDYPPKQYRNHAFKWLKVITFLCLMNAIMLFFIEIKAFYFFAFLFPLANSVVSNVIFGVLILLNMRMHYKVENSQYIINKYPHIWKKLHPLGKYSHNFIAYWNFIKGKYDKGEDDKLEAIKKNEGEKLGFSLWINLLSPASWMLNFFFIFLKKVT